MAFLCRAGAEIFAGVVVAIFVGVGAVFYPLYGPIIVNLVLPIETLDGSRSMILNKPADGGLCSIDNSTKIFSTPRIFVCFGGADGKSNGFKINEKGKIDCDSGSEESEGEAKWQIFFNSKSATSIIEHKSGAKNARFVGKFFDTEFHLITQCFDGERGKFEILYWPAQR